MSRFTIACSVLLLSACAPIQTKETETAPSGYPAAAASREAVAIIDLDDQSGPDIGERLDVSDASPIALDKTVSMVTETKRGRVQLDDCGHPSGACRQIRETARASYLYAQLANNAYNEDEIKIGGGVSGPKDIQKSFSGFGAQYYVVQRADTVPFCVIAYRGTDFTQVSDWIFGNLIGYQNRQGRDYYDTVAKNADCSGKMIRVTGHSLGGAIATYVSLRRNNTEAYVFNASPRLTRGRAIVNPRVAVSQYGEVLAAARHVFIRAGGTYTTINCIDKGVVGRHAIHPLAKCLTQIAASESLPGQVNWAAASVALNNFDTRLPILRSRLDN